MSVVLTYPAVYIPAALVALVAVRKVYQSLTSPIYTIPGPRGAHWFWGHEMLAFEGSCGDAYTRWIDSLGFTYKIRGALFHPDILVTVDIGAITHIFGQEPYTYIKSPVTRPIIERLIGRGLPWAEGDDHKRQRYQLAPFFSAQATSEMFEVIHTCSRIASDRLATYIKTTGNGKNSTRLDITDWTWRPTLDVIGRAAFDHDFECGESEDAKAIQLSWKHQVNAGLQKIGFVGLLVLRAFPFIVDLPFESIQAQGEVKIILQRIARSMIENGAHEAKDGNLLSTLVRLASVQESGISDEELLDHLTTVIIAGNETTAGSLSFAFYELSRRPDVQARLREEISRLGHEATYEDYMNGLPWLDAVTKETFRVHPAIPHMERTVLKDDVLRLRTPLENKKGGKISRIPVKAGQLIHIPTLSLGRLKSVWGEDAEEFRPERWLDPARVPSSSETPQGWNGLFMFSGGPRNCIGYRLAVLEFKVILTTYVRHFEFHDTGAIIRSKFAASLQPYVVGEETRGRQLPLRVSLVDTND